jgi:hypothetical protein
MEKPRTAGLLRVCAQAVGCLVLNERDAPMVSRRDMRPARGASREERNTIMDYRDLEVQDDYW